MGRYISFIRAVLFTVALWAGASRAEGVDLYWSLAPPPSDPATEIRVPTRPFEPISSMPERPAFEEFLFALADPDRALQGGFTAPSLAVAIRAHAWAFVPTGNYEQRDALNTLSQPTREVTLSDVPAGKHLASLLDLGPDADRLRVRELGPRLSGRDSQLQRGIDSALGLLHVPKPAAAVGAGVLALALLNQYGTSPATNLGLPVNVNASLFKGRLGTSFQLTSEPHFKNARADFATRIRLPSLGLRHLSLDLFEVGGVAIRTPEQVTLDSRWANLRGRVSWLQLCVGVHSSQAEPALWTVLETGVQRDRFSLRTVLSHQWQTARSRFQAMATLRTGPVLTGFFMGSADNGGAELVKHTVGFIGMGAF
jgi:hypothetical protein